MRIARNASAMIFGAVEAAYFFGFFLLRFENWISLFQLTAYLSVASWLAFILFASTVFRPLPYGWGRVVIAFIVFMVVPAVFSLAVTKQLVDADAAKLWFEVAFVATTALKFGIAGCIYVWSIAQERSAAAACA
jgi:hypothetical protein